MQATVRLFTVLDTVHFEIALRRTTGDWELIYSGHVPDPDAPTDADVVAYVLGELSEELHQDARARRYQVGL